MLSYANVIYFLSACIYLLGAKVNGFITNPPIDTESAIGHMANFSCTVNTSSSGIEWHHTPLGSAALRSIYVNRVVLRQYKERFEVQCDEQKRLCTLRINDINIQDAGKYTCIEESYNHDAELIVFEIYPSDQSCQLNVPSDGALGDNDCGMTPDTIELNCKMKYYGNKVPSMEWKDEGGTIIPPSAVNKDSNNAVSSSISFSASVNRDIICSIRYSETTIQSIIFIWRISVKVQNLINSSKIEQTGCDADSKKCTISNIPYSCESTWRMENKSFGSELNMHNLPSGKYLCIADCRIRSKSCTIQQLTVSHKCNKTNGIHPPTPSFTLSTGAVVGVVIGVLVLLILFIVIGFYILRRSSRQQVLDLLKSTHVLLGDTDQDGVTIVQATGDKSICQANYGQREKCQIRLISQLERTAE